jgi:hypothetical protein
MDRLEHWFAVVLCTAVVGTTSLGSASETRKLTAPDAARQGQTGFAAAIAGNVGFAGAPAGTSAPGVGYLFDLTTGDRTHTLVPSVSRSDSLFGFNAKMSASRVLVGDPGNPFASSRPSGAAYVFDVVSGGELARLQPNESFPGDEFGFGINLHDELAIIGAPNYQTGTGAAYLFDLVSGEQLQRFVPDDPLFGSDFGADVAVSDQYAVVGAPGNFEFLGLVPGAAYVFDVRTGQQLRKLQPDDRFGGDEFGFDVALDGNLAIIGAPDGGAGEGAAYLFDVATGQQIRKLVPEVSQVGNNFGASVDIDGNTILIGASALDRKDVWGAAYAFDVTTGRQLELLRPSDLQSQDSFGESVDLDGNRMFIGSPGDDDIDLNAGAAYLFELSPALTGDFNRNGRIDVGDIDLLTDAVRGGTDPAVYDLNGDGRVDQIDRVAWVEQIANTYFGDSDLDREFSSSDFVLVFQGGVYEDNVVGNADWATGDWDGNGDFDATDFVLAMQGGGYEQGPRSAVTAIVPEPCTFGIALLAMMTLVGRFGHVTRGRGRRSGRVPTGTTGLGR